MWPFVFTRLTARYGFEKGVGTIAGLASLLTIFVFIFSKPGPAFSKNPIGQPFIIRSWIPTKALKSRTFMLHCTGLCFIYTGILAVVFLMEFWAQERGIGVSEDTREGHGIDDHLTSQRVYLVVIMNAFQLPGRVAGSALCDK